MSKLRPLPRPATLLAGAAVLVPSVSSSFALAQGAPAVALRGYGSFGYAQLVDRREATVGGQELGYDEVNGISRRGSFTRDTRLGLNLTSTLTENLTAIAQLHAEGANSISGQQGDFKVETTIIALRYEPVEGLTFMGGQLVNPLWLISEEKAVGLTYPWIRPPAEIYNLDSESVFGVRGYYALNLGEFILRPGMIYGTHGYSIRVSPNEEREAPLRATLFNLELEHELFSVRGAYGLGSGPLTITREVVTPVATSTAPEPNLIANKARMTAHYEGNFISAGAKVNAGGVLFMGEWARRQRTLSGNQGGAFVLLDGHEEAATGMHATFGYAIGKFTPRVTYAKYERTNEADAAKIEKKLSPAVAAGVAAGKAGIEAAVTARVREGVGKKVDAQTGGALKGSQREAAIDAGMKTPDAKKLYADNLKQATARVTADEMAKAKRNVVANLEKKSEQDSIIVGVNYQWTDQAIVKLEWQRTVVPDEDDVADGVYFLPRGSKSQIVSAAVDFVF